MPPARDYVTPFLGQSPTLRDRAARMSAALLSELLSELLGIHIQTATRWRYRAEGGGSTYAAKLAYGTTRPQRRSSRQ